ncbi:MAG TPA: oligosaccharide flippase family protein [Burkholderiaceae bacterium]|nr:oligosaccharide flippase family protein [Burkholderiaceae bacterium]
MSSVTANLPPRRTVRLAVLRNFLWLFADKALAIVVGLVVFGLLARQYGPVGSGHYAYAMALLQTTLGLSFVCAAAAIMPRLCRRNHGVGAMVANVWIVRMVGTTLAAIAVAIFTLLTVNDHDRLVISLVTLMAAPLIEPFFIAVTYWQSRNLNRPPVIIRSVGLVARGAFVIVAVWLGAPVWVPALAWVLEALVAAVMQTSSMRALAPLSQLKRTITRQRAMALFRFGVRFQIGLLLSHLFLRTDRLVLAHLLTPHDFGIYGTAMQLVEVWLQIATIIGVSIGPAFFYRALEEGRSTRWYVRVLGAIACIGLLGVLGAWLLGEWALSTVFSPEFAAGYRYLVAGTGFAALFFVDQAVVLTLTAGNRPRALAAKWGIACATSALVLWGLFDLLGAFAGPVGLSAGMIASWIYLVLDRLRRPRPPRALTATQPAAFRS